MATKLIIYGDILDGIEKGGENGLLKIAMNVSNQAKDLAPVQFGNLKSSIGYKSSKQATTNLSTSVNDEEIIVGSALDYATYQEFGTRRMSAQPFLRPAVDLEARGKNAESVMKFYQQDSIKKAVKKGKKIVTM